MSLRGSPSPHAASRTRKLHPGIRFDVMRERIPIGLCAAFYPAFPRAFDRLWPQCRAKTKGKVGRLNTYLRDSFYNARLNWHLQCLTPCSYVPKTAFSMMCPAASNVISIAARMTIASYVRVAITERDGSRLVRGPTCRWLERCRLWSPMYQRSPSYLSDAAPNTYRQPAPGIGRPTSDPVRPYARLPSTSLLRRPIPTTPPWLW